MNTTRGGTGAATAFALADWNLQRPAQSVGPLSRLASLNCLNFGIVRQALKVRGDQRTRLNEKLDQQVPGACRYLERRRTRPF